MEFALTRAIAALCAAMAGIARVLFEDTLAYVTVRDQFGRKIGIFQALQHRLADMFIGVEEVVSLTWMAALAAESNDHGTRGSMVSAARIGVCD
jgi:pimeloyl-CoA dehydrogenase